ncbi:MAG: hypothetical protein KUG77_00930 [Nannocystaceae bacterium]|nr:hypothetical protein [Nannocystaceae bacterium]
MSDEVQAVPLRIDQGDRAARCELGQLMRQYEAEVCRGSLETLVMFLRRGRVQASEAFPPRPQDVRCPWELR